MDGINGRVLAYSLAKVIEEEELSQVSGGANVTNHQCLRPSGGGGIQSMDVVIDISVDY